MRGWIKRGVLSVFEQRDRNDRAEIIGRRGELHEVELMMPFGLSYCPPDGAGSEAIVMPTQGDNDMLMVSGFTGGSLRPKAEAGQAILYSNQDTMVSSNPDGSVTIRTNGGTLNVSNGSITTDMNITTTGDVIAGGISLKTHTHSPVTGTPV